jgi:hypothetical protein
MLAMGSVQVEQRLVYNLKDGIYQSHVAFILAQLDSLQLPERS